MVTFTKNMVLPTQTYFDFYFLVSKSKVKKFYDFDLYYYDFVIYSTFNVLRQSWVKPDFSELCS